MTGKPTNTERADVLIVDDNRDAAEALATLLAMDGYLARTCHSATEALALAESLQPHCVLLDIHMPGMDGLDLVRHFRQRYGDDVVLVAITGGDIESPRVAETFALVDHHFTKPVHPDDIRRLLPAH